MSTKFFAGKAILLEQLSMKEHLSVKLSLERTPARLTFTQCVKHHLLDAKADANCFPKSASLNCSSKSRRLENSEVL